MIVNESGTSYLDKRIPVPVVENCERESNLTEPVAFVEHLEHGQTETGDSAQSSGQGDTECRMGSVTATYLLEKVRQNKRQRGRLTSQFFVGP